MDVEAAFSALRKDEVEMLAKNVVPERINESLADNPRDRYSLLHYAIDCGSERCVAWLLAHGADPNLGSFYIQDGLDVCPVRMAITRLGRLKENILRLLVDAGADVNPEMCMIRNPHQPFSLLRAVHGRCSTDMLWYLICKGARLRLDEACQGELSELCAMADDRLEACRAACIVLLRRAPFQQRDLRRHWVRNFVWNTRYEPEWSDL